MQAAVHERDRDGEGEEPVGGRVQVRLAGFQAEGDSLVGQLPRSVLRRSYGATSARGQRFPLRGYGPASVW